MGTPSGSSLTCPFAARATPPRAAAADAVPRNSHACSPLAVPRFGPVREGVGRHLRTVSYGRSRGCSKVSAPRGASPCGTTASSKARSNAERPVAVLAILPRRGRIARMLERTAFIQLEAALDVFPVVAFDAAAMAVAETPNQVVEILRYVTTKQ